MFVTGAGEKIRVVRRRNAFKSMLYKMRITSRNFVEMIVARLHRFLIFEQKPHS